MMNRSRSYNEKCQDIELRLTLTSNFLRGPPNLIIIDDDDDDNEVYMYAPTSSRETRSFFPCPSSSVPAIREEDLDLRLGVKASNGSSEKTDGGDACTKNLSEETTKVKLKCAICMDTMKDETSTLCGHLFCKQCITNAIVAQKRCPACRTELSLTSIHRIFLPGAVS